MRDVNTSLNALAVWVFPKMRTSEDRVEMCLIQPSSNVAYTCKALGTIHDGDLQQAFGLYKKENREDGCSCFHVGHC